MSLATANRYVETYHRHHRRTQGMKFAIGARLSVSRRLIGVAIVGRPASRILDDGKNLEVLRCCTDGTANACSFLYGACWRIARELGYYRLLTYTLPSEGGASLRGAGWAKVSEDCGGGSWSREKRPREDKHPVGPKWRWEVTADGR
ncbi:MAG: XF1762 family protein [Dehalococcoidia bacterium]